jgi:hypothetical protein
MALRYDVASGQQLACPLEYGKVREQWIKGMGEMPSHDGKFADTCRCRFTSSVLGVTEKLCDSWCCHWLMMAEWSCHRYLHDEVTKLRFDSRRGTGQVRTSSVRWAYDTMVHGATKNSTTWSEVGSRRRLREYLRGIYNQYIVADFSAVISIQNVFVIWAILWDWSAAELWRAICHENGCAKSLMV